MHKRLSRDPIEEDGGWNLYAMVGNNPSNHWDNKGKGKGGFIFGWAKCFYYLYDWKKECEKNIPSCDPCLEPYDLAMCLQERNKAIRKCATDSSKMFKACISASFKF
ncbi:MAG: hypothetical protein MRZ86_01525 [Acidaminococcus sp.]|nr:hypothetical protein [Acidaminococcus sp.]